MLFDWTLFYDLSNVDEFQSALGHYDDSGWFASKSNSILILILATIFLYFAYFVDNILLHHQYM